MKKVLMVAASFVLVFINFAPFAGVSYADDNSRCRRLSVPVTLSLIDPTEYRVYGELCGMGSLSGKTVQVLVHGFTYDHNYWDFPFQPGTYSYVQHALDAGYATFAIDRIGAGLSSHPLSTLVTYDAHVFVLHQVVQGLRSGAIGGTPFASVVTVGHSAGADTVWGEASQYGDEKAVMITGALHQPSPTSADFFATLYPAPLDPKFATAGLDLGYLATMPGTRGDDFYNSAVADPAVIAEDEALKQTATSTELSTDHGTISPTVTQQIHVPVLIAVGQDDKLFCNPDLGFSCADSSAIVARESLDYNLQTTCLEAFVLPNAGHSINLHPNARDWFTAANAWAKRRVGPDVAHPATQPCPGSWTH